jgi:hypothetical protein
MLQSAIFGRICDERNSIAAKDKRGHNGEKMYKDQDFSDIDSPMLACFSTKDVSN